MIDFAQYTRQTRSGARVVVHPDRPFVLKYAQASDTAVQRRLIAQARFMHRAAECHVFPDVHLVFEYGYVMERLTAPLELLDVDFATQRLCRVHQLLSTRLWGERHLVAGTRILTSEHGLYVIARAVQFLDMRRQQRLLDTLHAVRALTLTAVDRIHGDPTLDNVMYSGADIIVTDPIPATAKMPALVAHDLGKMLQSVRGYEWVLAGRPVPDIAARNRMERLLLAGHTEADQQAARYFLIVHILRLLPYQDEALRPTFISWLNELL